MGLKPGTRLWSTVSSAAVVVVRPPAAPVALTCDGVPLVEAQQPGQADAPDGSGPVLGKRYADGESGLEVLCTRAGAGVLAADGRPLLQLGARALPASD
jgi:hypothetical protein